MTGNAQACVPNIRDGIDYWKTQPATLDGVLGGFGSGSLPRIDALGSRQFLLAVLPELCTVPSAHPDPSAGPRHQRRLRALDAGAGIGRVTSDVLLHLVSDVVLLEPVPSFASTALAQCTRAAGRLVNGGGIGDGDGDGANARYDAHGYARAWRGLAEGRTSVTVVQAALQHFDPARACARANVLGRVGHVPASSPSTSQGPDGEGPGFDVVWCQWCLGHLADTELVVFLRASKQALALRGGGRGVIVVKENVCAPGEEEDGSGSGGGCAAGAPWTVFDPLDSSVTRSDGAFKKIFAEAGLRVVRERVQRGFPAGLYQVKMYALRPL